MWDFGDASLSEQRFRRALDGQATSDEALQIETQIARALGLQGRFGDAEALLQSIRARLPEGLTRAHVLADLEEGRVLNSSLRQAQSIPSFVEARRKAHEIGADDLEVDALHMLGIVDDAVHRIDWNRQALQLASTSPQPPAQAWQASILNNLGWTYFEAERYDEALDAFQRAAILRAEAEEMEELDIARWCVARALRAVGRDEEALELQRRLAVTRPEDPYVHEELAELLKDVDPETSAEHRAIARRLGV